MAAAEWSVPVIDEKALRVTSSLGRGAFGLVKQGIFRDQLVCIKVNLLEI
jgi:hypothetical protein